MRSLATARKERTANSSRRIARYERTPAIVLKACADPSDPLPAGTRLVLAVRTRGGRGVSGDAVTPA